MALFPTLSYAQSTRIRAFIVALAYYAAASNILIPSATALFGPSTSPVLAVVLWFASSFLLAMPYALLWSRDRSQATWRLPVAIVSSVLPPLGLIGWASPLTAAGVLYPGTRWIGVAAVLLSPGLLVIAPGRSAAALAAGAIVAAVSFAGEKAPPPDWEAVSTAFDNTSKNPVEEYAILQQIQQRLHSSGARVIILAETVVPIWTEATKAQWMPIVRKLAENGQTALIGTRIPIPNGDRYRNVIVARGAATADFDQHIPVPIGMWRPFHSTGVPLNLTGPAILQIGAERIAPLICYEQFLVLPVLRAATEDATVLLAVSNTYWDITASVLNAQVRISRCWARLFSIPLLTVANAHAADQD
jgi:apolipoprotein N-acyltransferase